MILGIAWYTLAGLIGAGILAGFINVLAGSGSLLTLPFLMFLGLPANVANGTNRIAILLQNVVAVASFKEQKVLQFKQGIWLSIPAVIGSIIGAQIAVNLNEAIMHKTIGGLLVFMFFLILFKPSVWLKGKAGQVDAKPKIWQIIIFFFIGLYGGFIQAGVGFFLLAGLVLGAGFDLVKSNAIKVLIVLIYTVFALIVFVINDQVNYKFGLILSIGNMIGAFIGSRVAVSWGPKFVRYFLLFILLSASAKLFGLLDFFLQSNSG
ncbi:MAG: sulfite exporter TauE/SafE family protein [Bacteroidales bacterium]|nr:sulfite exporter TauE/SafE family protein [Bacteroidales bacterium]